MLRTKMMTSKEYVNLCIENANSYKVDEQLKQSKIAQAEAIIKEASEDLYKQQNKPNSMVLYNQFSESTKKILLSECIGRLYSGALAFKQKGESDIAVGTHLISKMLTENGVDSLLRSFKTKTLLLSEYSRIVTKYHKGLMEAVDKNNPDSFVIDTTIKDNFFDELNMTNPDDVIVNIRTRVADAVQEFIDSNTSDKLDIKDIIKTVQDKVATAKIDEVKESYSMLGKKAITGLKAKPKNVFGTMVSHVVESTLRNSELKAHYMTNGKMDIDRIVENCELMYTVLETMNTANIITVNENYIKEVLNGLKKA